MSMPESALFSENAPLLAPVLSAVLAPAQVSADLRAALDARESERAAFMALADELIQGLRPELERMTVQLVQRSLRQAWAARFRSALDGLTE